MRTISKNLYITVRDVEKEGVIKMVSTDNGDIIMELDHKATFKITSIEEALREFNEFLAERKYMENVEDKLGNPGPFFQVEHQSE